LAERPFW